MFTLQVIADKLNIRNTPQPDLSFANWVGDLPKGAIFNCDRLIRGGMLDNNNNWYADPANNFYWAGGVREIQGVAAGSASAFPWWITTNGIDAIWARTKGEGIKVAILDTGIDSDHFALSVAIKKKVFSAYKQGALPPDNQGTVDDLRGHGTQCAGMVAGHDVTTPAHCCGVAPKADLYVYKVFNDDAGDFPDFLITGLQDAINDQVDIISISRTYDLSPEVQTQLQKAIDQKIFVIVSGGNSTERKNPLMVVDGIIKVGAININGDDTFKAAPINIESADVLSCYAPGIDISMTSKDGGFITDSGTSFATPLIAGLFALKLALTGKEKPSFYDDIMQEFKTAIQPNPFQFKTPILKNFIT